MYTMKRTVRCSNIGFGGKIRLSALIDLLQDCAYDHLQNEPVLTPYFERTGNVMFLVSRQADILRLPDYNEQLEVSTWCYELKRMYGYRNTVIKDSSGNICVREVEIGAFAELDTQKPVKISEELVQSVQKEPKIDMEYLPRKITLPDNEPDSVIKVPVHSFYIDMYSHVNNARYLDMIDDLLPKDKSVKGIRTEYKRPLKYGADALIKVWNRQGSEVFSVLDSNNEVCCNLEVTFV